MSVPSANTVDALPMSLIAPPAKNAAAPSLARRAHQGVVGQSIFMSPPLKQRVEAQKGDTRLFLGDFSPSQ